MAISVRWGSSCSSEELEERSSRVEERKRGFWGGGGGWSVLGGLMRAFALPVVLGGIVVVGLWWGAWGAACGLGP